jgi:hypothetical protein
MTGHYPRVAPMQRPDPDGAGVGDLDNCEMLHP